MKEATHYVFSVGVSLFALSLFGSLSLYLILIAVWLSFSVNRIIDLLGHSRSGTPSRTRLTHSVFTAPVWGILVALVSRYVVSLLSPAPQLAMPVWVAVSLLIAMGHLFLDSMTQAGVFRWRSRIAIAHFAYDNAFVNVSFILVGIALIYLSFSQKNLLGTSTIAPIGLSLIAPP